MTEQQTASSPDMMGGAAPRGAGRRLNRAPLLFAFVMVCVVVAAMAYTHEMRTAEQNRRAAEKEPPQPASASQTLLNAPDSGLIPADRTPAPEPAAPPQIQLPQQAAQPADDPLWRARRQAMAQRQQLRDQAALAATVAPTAAQGFGQPNAQQNAERSAENSAASGPGDFESQAALGGMEGGDANHGEAKRRFLADGSTPKGTKAHYLASGREPPRSPYEVKTGTVIPATMIGGVNSDLPGQLLAQVSEHVYDTATGRFILIPQGAKLVGTYDNGVTTGQERVLVAWTRIIYPDASSIDLGKMPGADAAGYAGFHDKVNDHFWKAFGSAVMISLFTGGVQLSQGQNNSAGAGLNAQQIMSAALGQQMGQLGMEIARRNLQVQPTLEIRPGYRFVVQVTKDMILSPWRGMRRSVEAEP